MHSHISTLRQISGLPGGVVILYIHHSACPTAGDLILKRPPRCCLLIHLHLKHNTRVAMKYLSNVYVEYRLVAVAAAVIIVVQYKI
ncbi:hypothetical protein BOTBODRAFT_208918 [Botryobasidium botryosum FD-172 SS1]|uniref:Uncharacterized protein n=1 Tax=Botryobasidium botryosum (strain FD-172 SS1) TaxID=930990 RepID=A0A067N3T1_BOTB1|nr:hypothetical protein BOTBODRAFT_208918 [Botryobasidium botryosum FD-172 SS1]